MISIITVVKNDFVGLVASYESIRSNLDKCEWIVVDGGTDLRTQKWIYSLDYNPIYINEPDKNLYDAMNKGINLATRTHTHFLNAGDQFNGTKDIFRIISSLGVDEGFIGCISRFDEKNTLPQEIIKPKKFSALCIKYGIFPASHQGTIYPTLFLKQNLYDVNIGLCADQVSILQLLQNCRVLFSDSLIVAYFKNGGIGDTQKRGAFFMQMFSFRYRYSSPMLRTVQLIIFLPLLGIKVLTKIFAIVNRWKKT